MGTEADRAGPAASPAQEAYFERLRRGADQAYDLARQARRLRYDPAPDVEVVLAEDLAARVEAQVEVPGLADLVRRLTTELGSREVVALEAAKRIARGELEKYPGKAQAIDKAVRAGLSILTEGVVVAPLEGIAEVRLGNNQDGSDYVDLYFAGPIRAAGGGAQAMSVLIADVVRRELGVGRYRPTEAEIERYREEIPSYKRAANLQYTPSVEEIDAIVRDCPVCINGEGTEKEEITGHRDLPRVDTNRLRGGACLVIAEGLCLKAPKLIKHVKNLDLEGWGFLDRFARKKTEADADDESDGDEVTDIEPSEKYIKDLIAGRPVFAHPSRQGGFRLRYGRAPTAGLAATAISPVTMHALEDFLAVGTQIKIERPGKGTIATPCDTLEGPTLLLDNGDLVRVDTLAAWKKVKGRVRRIMDLGEILVPYGEFLENNQPLADASYVHEWWLQDLQAADPDAADMWREKQPDYVAALDLARQHGIPLHPDWTLLWHDLDDDAYERLRETVASHGRIDDGTLTLPDDPAIKDLLIALNGLHTRRDGRLRLGLYGQAVLDALALRLDDGRVATGDLPPRKPDARHPVVARVAAAIGVSVKARAPTRIGARMGRPEKADARKMNPPVHGLYPFGTAGGNQRKLSDALNANPYTSPVGRRRCLACGRESYRMRCLCGSGTEPKDEQPTDRKIGLKDDVAAARKRLDARRLPDIVKGVQGLISENKWPEPIEKGILRAQHEVYVFKDGTVRFDMTDAPLTHFTPQDIGTPVARLRELGYEKDGHGEPLERDDQLVELKVQDVVISRAGGKYLLRASQFVDDLLTKYYGLDPYYGATRLEDLVGHLVVGLAPHTSAGVLGRVVGFTSAQVGWAHPFFHAGKRRNCLVGETEVSVSEDGAKRVTTLERLYHGLSSPGEPGDAVGTRAKTVEVPIEIEALSLADGRIQRRRIRRVYRIPSPNHLVRIHTEQGRTVTCSPEHRIVRRNGRGWEKVPASRLNVSDSLVATAASGEIGGRGIVVRDSVAEIEIVPSTSRWLYDLEVDDDHTYATEHGTVVSNCDGDEDAVMLLMDCFLNFSRGFVPDRRGGLMDLPLVLTTRLDPNEIDKEAHNVDCAWTYPRAFYGATERHAHPKEVVDIMDIVENRLGTPAQYEGFGVTHVGSSIHQGPVSSSYKTLGAMRQKMDAQFGLADRIRAVDAIDVADRVISTHLLPDLLGNLKAFTRQKVRCTKCNAKYRRVPLAGTCTNRAGPRDEPCGNTLTLTVHEKSVKKYLEIVQELEDRYDLPAYTRQRIRLAVRYMEDAFAPDKYVTPKLGTFSA